MCYMIIMELQDKLKQLEQHIKQMDSLAVAYSGGVDSTFLLKVAHDVLKGHVIAVTAMSSTYPEREFKEAAEFPRGAGIEHIVIESEELEIEGFTDNPPNRCYLCKYELFSKIKEVAEKNNIQFIAEGSNVDDLGDYRPGMQAIKELGIISPLKDAGLDKDEIRILSKQMGLPTWDKPAFACLASRFPYGEKITKVKLDRLATAEFEVRKLGFTQFRIRSHENLARLEFIKDEMDKAWRLRENLTEICKKSGFNYVSIDLIGYRTGSMNETLSESDKKEYKLRNTD